MHRYKLSDDPAEHYHHYADLQTGQTNGVSLVTVGWAVPAAAGSVASLSVCPPHSFSVTCTKLRRGGETEGLAVALTVH